MTAMRNSEEASAMMQTLAREEARDGCERAVMLALPPSLVRRRRL